MHTKFKVKICGHCFATKVMFFVSFCVCHNFHYSTLKIGLKMQSPFNYQTVNRSDMCPIITIIIIIIIIILMALHKSYVVSVRTHNNPAIEQAIIVLSGPPSQTSLLSSSLSPDPTTTTTFLPGNT